MRARVCGLEVRKFVRLSNSILLGAKLTQSARHTQRCSFYACVNPSLLYQPNNHHAPACPSVCLLHTVRPSCALYTSITVVLITPRLPLHRLRTRLPWKRASIVNPLTPTVPIMGTVQL